MHLSRLQCATRLFLGLGILSASLLPARSEAMRCALDGDLVPRGLVVVLPERTYDSMNLEAMKNPYMSGVKAHINWRDIEPVQGKPDWSKLDALFAAAEAARKWVYLGISPGFFSPVWALAGAESDQFEMQYGPGRGTLEQLPMPWDRVYLGHWFEFMRLVSARYGGLPAFRMIAAAGPTSVSSETTLPNQPSARQRLLAHGYTYAKYVSAWEEAFRFYAMAFPNQCISLAGLNVQILAPRTKDAAAGLRVKQEFVERARQAIGSRLAIQWNDLHAGHAAVEAPDNIQFINSYNGRVITGFEMRSQSQNLDASRVMGAEGDPPLALRRSIEKGMAPNPSGRHVDYLEIYVADVVPAAMQPVLSYAASLFQH